MQHSQTSLNRDIIKRYNGWGFTIRGQEFKFEDYQSYREAFSKALEIADKQRRCIESGRSIEEFDLEEALRDSDTEEQFEMQFTNEDPNERFSDDIDPAHRE